MYTYVQQLLITTRRPKTILYCIIHAFMILYAHVSQACNTVKLLLLMSPAHITFHPRTKWQGMKAISWCYIGSNHFDFLVLAWTMRSSAMFGTEKLRCDAGCTWEGHYFWVS